jgi:hypothetical protein
MRSYGSRGNWHTPEHFHRAIPASLGRLLAGQRISWRSTIINTNPLTSSCALASGMGTPRFRVTAAVNAGGPCSPRRS